MVNIKGSVCSTGVEGGGSEIIGLLDTDPGP